MASTIAVNASVEAASAADVSENPTVLRDGWMASMIAANAPAEADAMASLGRSLLPDPYPATEVADQLPAYLIIQAEIDAALAALEACDD